MLSLGPEYVLDMENFNSESSYLVTLAIISTIHLLPDERERLTSDLSGAAAAVLSLQDEVLTLQREVNLVNIHYSNNCSLLETFFFGVPQSSI
jgi:hypothetical protein